MKTKMFQAIRAGAFLLALLLPVLNINRTEGRISETEKRRLAAFPEFFESDGGLNHELREEFSSWLGDNIGFRDDLVRLTANIQVHCLHRSANEKVELGKEDWCYYVPEHNIQLATGEFSLSDGVLEKIAKNQQMLSDWYAAQGIPYFLALFPAKTSVYPEYIASGEGEYGLRETPCDQLEAYLKEHTDVNVINVKAVSVANKDQGKMFCQHDTHMTELGTYVGYSAIAQKMEEAGIGMADFSVRFTDVPKQGGDLAEMLGASDILGTEIVPTAEWDRRGSVVTEGELWEQIESFVSTSGSSLGYALVEDPAAANGTLLVYGDSQWQVERNLPQLFGESFKTTVYIGYRVFDRELDETLQPDAVIFSCGERGIDSILTSIPAIPGQLPELPQREMIPEEEYGQWIADRGIYVDHASGGAYPVTLTAPTVVSGWAADFGADAPLQSLYVQIGGYVLECDYGREREDVAEHFQKDSLLRTGFRLVIPASYWDGAEEITFVGVSSDGKCCFAPVTYDLAFS